MLTGKQSQEKADRTNGRLFTKKRIRKKIVNTVVRYVLTSKDGEVVGSYHTKKIAELKKNEYDMPDLIITKYLFDATKIKPMDLDGKTFRNAIIFCGKIIPTVKHYLFDAKCFDYPFEIGMAIDYLNGYTESVMIKPINIAEWM